MGKHNKHKPTKITITGLHHHHRRLPTRHQNRLIMPKFKIEIISSPLVLSIKAYNKLSENIKSQQNMTSFIIKILKKTTNT